MILWLVMTAMIAIAAVFVSAPFIRRHERRRLAGADLAIYGDQLEEVEREASLGLIDAEQAESARIEIKRRMLAAHEDGGASKPGLSSGERSFAAVAVAAIVVLGSISLFALTGDFEPAPAATRIETPIPFASAKVAGGQSEIPAAKPTATAAQTTSSNKAAQTTLPPVDELIQRILVRLQRNPKDVQGWRMLGWSYFGIERFSESAEAYARAIELEPNSTEFRNGRTEALIRAANEVVTGEAKKAIEETLEIDPKDPRARYLQGLAIEQAGDKASAQAKWKQLLSELDPKDAWTKELQRKIAAAEKGDAVTARSSAGNVEQTEAASPSAPSGESENASAAVMRGPSAEDVRAAEAMTPSDRAAMIRRMVDSLAEKLDKSPRDADGWIKLIRSFSTLGESDRAQQALDKALKTFSDDPADSARLTTTAKELGLSR